MTRELTGQWLEAEVEQAWLLGERMLRWLQERGLTAAPDAPRMGPIESLLAERSKGGEALAARLAAVTRALAGLRRQGPLGRVIETLGLRPLEVDVWMLAVATQLDPMLGPLLGAVRTSVGGGDFDLALAADVLMLAPGQRVELLDVMDPARPLLAWRLVHVGSGEATEVHRPLRPDFDVLSILSGRVVLEPALSGCAELSEGPAPEPLLHDPATASRAAELTAAVSAAGDVLAELPWVIAWGPHGAGKRSLARSLAAAAGRPLLAVRLPDDAAQALLRLAAAKRAALVRGAVLYVGPISEARLGDGWDALARELASHPGFAVLGLETAHPPLVRLPRSAVELALGWPEEAARALLWQRWVPAELCAADVDLPALARAFRLTPGEIREIACEAAELARIGRASLRHGDLRAGIERRLRNDLGRIARRLSVSARWQDLVLPEDNLARVREFVARGRHADAVWGRWGFGGRVSYGTGMVALLSGPPGTGKTMLAGLIAAELGLELYAVDLSQVVSKWIGETEKQIVQLFDAAERAHAVLLFDEADALFAKRSTDVDSGQDRHGNSAVNCLLQRMEQYRGVAVLTTNKEAALDEALRRRVQLHLRIDKPEPEERTRLWRSLVPAACEVAGELDFAVLGARYDLTGGHIKNAAVRAAFLAADEGGVLTSERLHRAAVLELEDLGRLVQRAPAPPPLETTDEEAAEPAVYADFLDA